MPELLDVTQLILKHLLPSADVPNVYTCDERSRRWGMALEQPGRITLNEQQAIDGVVAFMQPAVPAGALQNINKLLRYEVVHLIKRGLPMSVSRGMCPR